MELEPEPELFKSRDRNRYRNYNFSSVGTVSGTITLFLSHSGGEGEVEDDPEAEPESPEAEPESPEAVSPLKQPGERKEQELQEAYVHGEDCKHRDTDPEVKIVFFCSAFQSFQCHKHGKVWALST
jgi:hypothetical protein